MNFRPGPRLLVGAVAIATSLVAAASAQSASNAAPPAAEVRATTRAPADPSTSPNRPARPTRVSATLLTGDRVEATTFDDGRRQVTVVPAPRRGTASFYQYADDGQVYVIPTDAAPLVPDVLDPELFNVTKLAESGYDDATPVIVEPTAGARGFQRADAPGLAPTTSLPSIAAVAATVAGDGRWWRSLLHHPSTVRSPAAAGRLPGIEKVWLDQLAQVTLDESVPMIGAPRAWAAGYDGTGTTVAVLDTGVDAGHADLAGKVRAAENFTSEPSVSDLHGHGTHVASTIAGSGAASSGRYRGVAPGADLLSGKVCDAGGDCAYSAMIAGMQWAAPRADVVSLSIGGAPSDGTDPLSLAVDQLTEQHGTLFVIAAGNNGPGERTVASPGAADSALTVGAVSTSEELAGFSSRGPRLGDWAIKPDVTAPGVDIVAARATGTTMGSPVDASYTMASGTSMATPHVSGAAAILLDRHPDLSPADVKSALTTTSVANPGLSVYEQGGGRIDVAAALEPTVRVAPASLSLGYFQFPHDGARPTERDVTYTNHGSQPVTLDLSLDVRSQQGTEPSEAMLSVEPATLTVAPGQTATATVRLDVGQGDVGLYGGYLVASTDAGEVVRSPVGFHKEAEAYELTITGIDRNGDSASGNVAVLDVENMSRFFRPAVFFENGVATVRVPPGTYAVLGAIQTYDQRREFVQSSAFVGDPEITVTGDTDLLLDARQANRITLDVPIDAAVPQGGVSFGYWRSALQPGPLFNPTWLVQHAAQEYYAMPMEPVGLGQFEFHSHWRLAAPEAELSVVWPRRLRLDPVLLRPPAVDGRQLLEMVDVGVGHAGDYVGRDVDGKAVLVRRGDISYVEQEQHAAAAGAAALIVSNDVPGRLTGPVSIGDGSIPTLALTEDEGAAVRRVLATGSTRIQLSGTRWSPYVYDLAPVEVGQIPEDMGYEFTRGQLARLEVDYHNDVRGHEMLEGRHFSRPYHSGSILLHPAVEGPRARTEYVIGGDQIGYHQTVYGEHLPPDRLFEARLEQQGVQTYDAGETVEVDWFGQVMRPALLPGVEATVRDEDTLRLSVHEWVDSGGNYFPTNVWGSVPYPGDTITTRVWRDDELVGELSGSPRGTFPMTSGAADYRIRLDVTRDADWWRRSIRTLTEWRFRSAHPEDGSAVLPLLSIDYDAGLDLANTAPSPWRHRGPARLRLDIRQQSEGLPAVAGARAWVSCDDGDRWRPADVRRDGEQHSVALPGAWPLSCEAVSLRVRAWDVAGNSIDQTIIRAWHLR